MPVEAEMAEAFVARAAKRRVRDARLVVCRGEEAVLRVATSDGHRVHAESAGRLAFPLGSLTKPFTATLAMLLVEDGDVDLDEPVSEHLPELAGADGSATGITVRRLLSHRAGLASDLPEGAADPKDWMSRLCHQHALVCPPGTAFSYSNAGYAVVGRLIEAVTGMRWCDAVESILLRPLEISPVVLGSGIGGARPVARGHTVHAGGVEAVVAERHRYGPGAAYGGLALGVDDLVKFVHAHLGMDPLLGEQDGVARLMRTDQVIAGSPGPTGLADGWGLGWAVYRDTGVDWFGHDGMDDGLSCHLRFEPSTGSVVALLSNSSGGFELWSDVVDLLRAGGTGVGDHPFLAGLSPDERTPPRPDCLGVYRNGEQEFVVGWGTDGQLSLRVGRAERGLLTCYGDGLRFALHDRANGRFLFRGAFVPDPDTGRVGLMRFAARLARKEIDEQGATGAGRG
ncbi:hypothetical protein C1701_01090 [Actinoalloteichus sp. AHMU CJ021]|uniref:serine hydrolase domain-containing protein n=1 Tax=Actinoalloteichus TaxID=65496 RepID=UPI00068DF09F|nr:serine hydrolase domain-containing protein [Actinoalloteichus caeruleus]AUS77190.1 hypothetical protein C1701_01090 [Actinoalloteichus sp. AHMU CJ021]